MVREYLIPHLSKVVGVWLFLNVENCSGVTTIPYLTGPFPRSMETDKETG